jgi:hypothetical protein
MPDDLVKLFTWKGQMKSNSKKKGACALFNSKIKLVVYGMLIYFYAAND